MNLTISPQIRIVALVGLVAALGGLASMTMLGRSGSKTATSAAPTRAAHTLPAKTVPAKTVPAKTRTTPAAVTPAAHHATARPATRHQVKHVTKHAGYRGFPVYAQLPQALQWQLAHHKVVVVSVYNPRSDVDAISVAEAHAGATDANAGFLLVSVLDNKVAGLLTALLPGGGLLPDPGVLVYRAPGNVALRIDGFADRASVAQAATNAFAGETGPAATSSVAAPAATTTAAAPTTTTTP
jgi:hypothetical protein